MGMNADSAGKMDAGMRAVKQSIGDMANAGDIDGLVSNRATMEQQMSPDELIAFANSTPQLNAALAKVGLRVDSVTGKIEAIPRLPTSRSAQKLRPRLRTSRRRAKAVETDNTDPNIRVTKA